MSKSLPAIEWTARKELELRATGGIIFLNEDLDLIRTAALALGYSNGPDISATATIIGNPPVVSGIGRIGFFDNYVFIDGKTFKFWDPLVDTLPTVISPNDIWVIKGATLTDSQNNLAAEISATTFNAAVVSDNQINLLSKLAGTAGNGHPVSGNGSLSVAGDSRGGGWTITSVDYNGSYFTVAMIVGDFGEPRFDFKFGGGSLGHFVDYRFGQYHYKVFMDPYQMVITPEFDAPFHGGDIFQGNNSFLICTPFTPDDHTLTFGAHMIYGFDNVRTLNSTYTVNGRINGQIFTATFYPSEEKGFALLFDLENSGPMTTWNEDPYIYSEAFVQLSPSNDDTYVIYGKYWNAMFSTEIVTAGTRRVYDGKTMFAMNISPQGTLWWGVE